MFDFDEIAESAKWLLLGINIRGDSRKWEDRNDNAPLRADFTGRHGACKVVEAIQEKEDKRSVLEGFCR